MSKLISGLFRVPLAGILFTAPFWATGILAPAVDPNRGTIAQIDCEAPNSSFCCLSDRHKRLVTSHTEPQLNARTVRRVLRADEVGWGMIRLSRVVTCGVAMLLWIPVTLLQARYQWKKQLPSRLKKPETYDPDAVGCPQPCAVGGWRDRRQVEPLHFCFDPRHRTDNRERRDRAVGEVTRQGSGEQGEELNRLIRS